MHEYYERKINIDTQIDKHLSNYWKRDTFVTSQQQDYLSTIRDQELRAKSNILDTKEHKTVEKTLIVIINVDYVLLTLKI